jgi:hypothetical protein
MRLISAHTPEPSNPGVLTRGHFAIFGWLPVDRDTLSGTPFGADRNGQTDWAADRLVSDVEMHGGDAANGAATTAGGVKSRIRDLLQRREPVIAPRSCWSSRRTESGFGFCSHRRDR